MPEFKLDFEVYCTECNVGLCNESEVDQSRYNANRVYVNPCPECLKEKDSEIDRLLKKVEDLEEELEDLQNE